MSHPFVPDIGPGMLILRGCILVEGKYSAQVTNLKTSNLEQNSQNDSHHQGVPFSKSK